MQDKRIKIAKNILLNNLSVKLGEKVLILIDSSKEEIGNIFYEASELLGAVSFLLKFKQTGKSGEEPPFIIGEVMRKVDVVLCITKHSISHTQARKNAVKSLSRVGTMPGLTIDMLDKGALHADYNLIKKRGKVIKEKLDIGRKVLVITGNGKYQLSFDITDRKSKVSSGLLQNPGDSGNLPSGETFIAPIEETGNGKILIDGSIAGIGLLKTPILLTISNGKLIDVAGEDSEILLNMLGEGNGRQLGELGIGLNDHSIFTGKILEDEKKYGTCHIAFGTNNTFGGRIKANVHIDLVTLYPEIIVDDNTILTNGNLNLKK